MPCTDILNQTFEFGNPQDLPCLSAFLCYACTCCSCDYKNPMNPQYGKPLFCGEAMMGQCCCEKFFFVMQCIIPEYKNLISFKYALCCCEEHCQCPPSESHPCMIAICGIYLMGGQSTGVSPK